MGITIACLVMAATCAEQESIYKLEDEKFITLGIGEQVLIQYEGDPFTLHFKKVTEDNRCPEDVTCVWAGRAVISISFDNNDPVHLGIGDLDARRAEPVPGIQEYKSVRVQIAEIEGSMASMHDYKVRLQLGTSDNENQ